MELQKSFQKGFIQLKSRLVIPPMATQSSDSGIPGKETIDHYRRLAGNSLAGLLITEHSYVNPAGRADPHQLSMASDEVVADQRKLTDAVHAVNPNLKNLCSNQSRRCQYVAACDRGRIGFGQSLRGKWRTE